MRAEPVPRIRTPAALRAAEGGSEQTVVKCTLGNRIPHRERLALIITHFQHISPSEIQALDYTNS